MRDDGHRLNTSCLKYTFPHTLFYFVPDFFLDLNMLKNDPLFFFSGFAAAMSAGADVVRAGADCLASGGTSGEFGAGPSLEPGPGDCVWA